MDLKKKLNWKMEVGLLGQSFCILKRLPISDVTQKEFTVCNIFMSDLESPTSHIKHNLTYWDLSTDSLSRCHQHLSFLPEDRCQGSRLSFEGIPNNNGSGFLAAGQSFISEVLPA